MSRRERVKTVAKVERRKRIMTYVTVERQVVALGPVAAAFASAIRTLRTDAAMTQQQVADAVGLSRPSVVNIETGRQRVYLEDVWAFAKALHTTPTELFAAVAKRVD